MGLTEGMETLNLYFSHILTMVKMKRRKRKRMRKE